MTVAGSQAGVIGGWASVGAGDTSPPYVQSGPSEIYAETKVKTELTPH